MNRLLLYLAFLFLPFAAAAQASRPRATHKTVTHHAGAKAKKARATSGPTVYYCDSGNRVKYHASPGCRGLSRCGAAVVPVSLASAQQSMEPCKWCY